MNTPFEQDMGSMVRESTAPESKKSMAMTCVRATGRIANGERENLGSISDAILAQTPILLEMYLERHAVLKDVEEAIDRHLANCPVGKLAVVKMRKGDTGEEAGLFEGMNWQRMFFTAVTRIGWPGALVLIVYMLREEMVSELVKALAGS